MGLLSLTVYGVGDMVGAGIYGTIGAAAGLMGNAVWLAFVVSMVAALLTGLSYASLGSRYPRAGGAAYVVRRAYGRPFLAYLVGLAVAASGMTSMAAGANVFAQTLSGSFWALPPSVFIVAFILLLAGINLAGIRESMAANFVCTLVEVGGLVFVIVVGARFWGDVSYLAPPPGVSLTPSLLLSGAVLTFYAFIGFEDVLNVAEEVKEPERNVPLGIVGAVVIASLLYVAVSVTAVSVVEAPHLADPTRGAPLAQLTAKAAPWLPRWVFGAITLFAVANTALLNYIMGSRLLYGMAREGLVPSGLGRVHERTRTPHVAIVALGAIVLTLAFAGNIKELASATSLLLLACFCLVNGALLVLQSRAGEARGRWEVPWPVPALGVLVCAGLIAARLLSAGQDTRAPLIACVMIAGIAALYLVLKPKTA